MFRRTLLRMLVVLTGLAAFLPQAWAVVEININKGNVEPLPIAVTDFIASGDLGQRISDVLGLEWRHIGKDGVWFRPAKTEDSTGVQVLIEWTPRLHELVDRVRKLSAAGSENLFTTQAGQPYTYEAMKSAWRRALTRSGVADAHIHDLRAKALTDVDKSRGVTAAQRMGAHSTQSQTADYVRHKQAIRAVATR